MELVLTDIIKITRNLLVVVIIAGLVFALLPNLFTGLVDGLYASLLPDPTIEKLVVEPDSETDANNRFFAISFKIEGDVGKVGEIKAQRHYQHQNDNALRDVGIHDSSLTAGLDDDVKGIVDDDGWVSDSVPIYGTGSINQPQILTDSVKLEEAGQHQFTISIYDSNNRLLDAKTKTVRFYDQNLIDLDDSVISDKEDLLESWINSEQGQPEIDIYTKTDSCYLKFWFGPVCPYQSTLITIDLSDPFIKQLTSKQDHNRILHYLEDFGREKGIIDDDTPSLDTCFDDGGNFIKDNCDGIQTNEISKMLPALTIHAFKKNFVWWRSSGDKAIKSYLQNYGYPDNSNYTEIYDFIRRELQSIELKAGEDKKNSLNRRGWSPIESNPNSREASVQSYVDFITTPAVSISNVVISRAPGHSDNAEKMAVIDWDAVVKDKPVQYELQHCWYEFAIDLAYITKDRDSRSNCETYTKIDKEGHNRLTLTSTSSKGLIDKPGMHVFEIKMILEDDDMFNDETLQKDVFKTGFYDSSYIENYYGALGFPRRDYTISPLEFIGVCVEKVNPTKVDPDACGSGPNDHNPVSGNLAECGDDCSVSSKKRNAIKESDHCENVLNSWNKANNKKLGCAHNDYIPISSDIDEIYQLLLNHISATESRNLYNCYTSSRPSYVSEVCDAKDALKDNLKNKLGWYDLTT